jgi:phosphatidylinositol phospholipase C delta
MVEIMHHVFGDTLVSAPVEGRPKFEALPSPEQLKGRVLLKVKIIIFVACPLTRHLQAKNLYTSESEPVRPKEVSVNAESSSTETSTDSEVIQEIRNEWKKSRAIEIEAMNGEILMQI